MGIVAERRLTAPEILRRKHADKIVMLTAYHHNTAQLVDPHCDIILVGDSLGNVLYGFDTTLPVTLDMMILHGRAVVKGSAKALIVVDMPFKTYERSPGHAYDSASQIMQETGCGAVKLEGGEEIADTIAFLTARSIPVMGHVGLTPQSIHSLGSFRSLGKDEAAALTSGANGAGPIERAARAVADAGAFSIVLEAIAEPLARHISQTIDIPTIGIGASDACDGQVLVLEDMLGLTGRTAKFVRQFGQLGSSARAAIEAYSASVRDGSFPDARYLYGAQSQTNGAPRLSVGSLSSAP